MSILNPDVIFRIGSFLDLPTTLSFASASKQIQMASGEFLKNQYEKHFGKIGGNIQDPDKKIVARLLNCAEKQPNVFAKSICEAPKSRLEWVKWVVGVENKLDKEIQETYAASIRMLENTQATTIFQLKNQLQGFWHSDCQIKDYKHFKSKEIQSANRNVINKIFFFCVGMFFKLYYNSLVIETGKKLVLRAEETFADIGGFNLNSKQYDVLAFHRLSDGANYGDTDAARNFNSYSSGRTHIGIVERNQPHSLEFLGGQNYFGIFIAREVKGSEGELCSENTIGAGNIHVLKNRRHLIVGDAYRFGDSTEDVHGSDRLLDQKLTQIMIEMIVQNKEIINLKINTNGDELKVFVAAGFKTPKLQHSPCQKIIQDLVAFRSLEGNKLFPPHVNDNIYSMTFEAKDLANQDVYYSRSGPESWSDIIQREPLLTPNSVLLPEYWVVKPKIVDQ